MFTAILLAMAMVALVVSALEVGAVVRHLSKPVRALEGFFPRVSVLKPLCGADASLSDNVRSFLSQNNVDYEVLLGVRDTYDAAYPLARSLADQFPNRVRVLVQDGEPGVNPKVNQLCTLARHARGDVFVISDSNVRVTPSYLADLVAPLANRDVGMVTSPIAGMSGEKFGGRIDALHLHTFVTPGVIGSRKIARRDLFIGKSMAFRREDLAFLGGFEAFADVLAEDHALGRAMLRAGKRAELARVPVVNVTDSSVKQAFDRYARWGLMQRWIAGPGYPAQVLTFPLMLAMLAAIAGRHDPRALALAAVIAFGKLALDVIAIRKLSGAPPKLSTLLLMPLKELVVFGAFLKAFTSNAVNWRGKKFIVTRGTKLIRAAA